jgi:hypothetical protein
LNYSPHPDFVALYKAYTSDPNSIGNHLTQRMALQTANDPLLVVTGSDVVLFPGSQRPAVTESFRKSTRGFFELASISHLGTAVPWIVRLRELGGPMWREDARLMIERIDRARQINTAALWANDIAVPALAGYESKIADMVEYSCAVTRAFLVAGLADESRMTFETVRREYLEPTGSAQVPVPINDMMVATFALAFLDIAYRIIRWVGAQNLDWQRVMIMLSGRSGRPTSGLTWASNNMCHLLSKVSNGQLAPERVYVAPHAPSFVLADAQNEATLRTLETEFRGIWWNTRSSVELAGAMFEGFPAFRPASTQARPEQADAMTVSEMPPLRWPGDRFTAITRLRFVMEDPTQLLANSVASYIIDALCENGNRPADVVIPGFTNVTYPGR